MVSRLCSCREPCREPHGAEALGPAVLQLSTELPPGTPAAEAIAVGELAAPLLAGLEGLALVLGANLVGAQPPSSAPSGELWQRYRRRYEWQRVDFHVSLKRQAR